MRNPAIASKLPQSPEVLVVCCPKLVGCWACTLDAAPTESSAVRAATMTIRLNIDGSLASTQFLATNFIPFATQSWHASG